MNATDLFDLKGRVALVTGASSGLGARFSKVLAANGAAVVLVARRADRLAEDVAAITASGGRAIAIEADVLDRAAMNRAFDVAEQAFGTVDVLINNAGIAPSSKAVDASPEHWQGVIGTNLDAVFFWAQEGARRLLAANKPGAIVNTASILGFGVSKGVVAYATAKAGVIQVTKALALELGSKGIRVNAIAPGWFITELNHDYLNSPAGEAIRKEVPIGRFGQDGDLDGVLLLLVAAKAGAYIKRRNHGRRWRSVRRVAGIGASMDFSLPPEFEDLRQRSRAFIAEHVLPLERDPKNFSEHENIPESSLDAVRAKARAEGLWAPQSPKEYGGMGLPIVGWAALYEEAARSVFGPLVFNCMAPDDGNMNVLALTGTAAQKEKWLRPITEGKVRSAFAMTEPAPGGGSDPGMIRTRAEKRGDKYVVTGRKWFITGADGASHFILIARTSDDARRGLTAFLFHKDQPGWRIVRRIEIMGPEEHGGHCELEFDGLEIPAENVLLKEGDGLKVTQIRLGPARLTHCMRWLGFSKRCVEIAQDYVARREGFGVKLADRESVQIKLGEIAQQIQIGRLLTMHAAWMLDQGGRARKEISMAKVQVADTLHKAADLAVQLQGARGYSKDTVAEWLYRYGRSARLVDGATEVHMMVLARFLRDEGSDFWEWGPGEGRKRHP